MYDISDSELPLELDPAVWATCLGVTAYRYHLTQDYWGVHKPCELFSNNSRKEEVQVSKFESRVGHWLH